MSQSRDRVLTIPNLVSFLRLIGVGFFWWLLLSDRIAAAAWLIFIVGWTDWLDGYLARRLDQVSKLGAALDPIADRLMIISAVVGGLMVGVIPTWIGIPLLAREALMALVTMRLVTGGHGVLEVRYVGKLATFVLYGAIPSFYLAAAGVLPTLMRFLGWFFGVMGLVLYWYSAFGYIGDARVAAAGVKSPDPEKRGE